MVRWQSVLEPFPGAVREELPPAAFTNREDSPLSSELSTLAAKRKIGKNPSFASCVNVRKYKNAPRKILRRFFFRRGHFPLSSEGSGKTVRSWESIRFFPASAALQTWAWLQHCLRGRRGPVSTPLPLLDDGNAFEPVKGRGIAQARRRSRMAEHMPRKPLTGSLR